MEHDRDVELHGQATAADTTPDGKRLVVCTYNALWLFDIDDPNQPLRGHVAWLPFVGPEEVEAACFADDKTILVADEPTGDLDASSAGAIMQLLTRLNTELGKTLIMVTHDARSAAYARRTLHLEKGRLVEAASLQEARQREHEEAAA